MQKDTESACVRNDKIIDYVILEYFIIFLRAETLSCPMKDRLLKFFSLQAELLNSWKLKYSVFVSHIFSHLFFLLPENLFPSAPTERSVPLSL